MKILILILLGIVISGLAYFFYLGYKSQTDNAPNNVQGLVNGRLSPCAKKPNCICTEYPNDAAHFIQPIPDISLNIEDIKKAITSTGGIITSHDSHYISATYTSRLFKYVDDFEVRIDEKNKQLHFRSASRVGHSDMGVNLKRIETIKQHLKPEARL